jgi:ribosomal-protein-alanine N-acetyltransferase
MTSEPFPVLSTSRLRLRCVHPDDAVGTSLLMTPTISRWLASWPTPFTVGMAKERIRDLRELAFHGDALPFAITSQFNGELLGWTTITRNESDRASASLGFWLGERHHGRGYMREIMPIVISAGFDLLTVEVIEAGAQISNAGSFGVMKAAGMRPSGERMVYASARGNNELCLFYERRREPLLS